MKKEISNKWIPIAYGFWMIVLGINKPVELFSMVTLSVLFIIMAICSLQKQ